MNVVEPTAVLQRHLAASQFVTWPHHNFQAPRSTRRERGAWGSVMMANAKSKILRRATKENAMIDVRLTQIRLPTEPDWTHERDRKYVGDLIGDEWDFEALMQRCFDSLRDMSASLRQALAYFGENIEGRVHSNVPDLIYEVEKRIRERAPSNHYLDRFIGHLTVCRF